jgi:hypothetical protein
MSNDVDWLIETMRVRQRGYWAVAQHPEIFDQLFSQFIRYETRLSRSLARQLRGHHHLTPDERYKVIFRRLAKPSSFSERAAWTIFWTFANACDSIVQSAHADDQEPELNGMLIKAIEDGCRRFLPRANRAKPVDCIAVGLLNLAKLGNEARMGADFGIAIEVEVGARKYFVVSHVQAKRARSSRVDVHRKAGISTQVEKLAERDSGRYLFYNQLDDLKGLFPTTMSAELVKGLSDKGAVGVDPIALADDFAVSMAAAVDYVVEYISAPARDYPARRFGYDFADSLDGAVSILFPSDADGMNISSLLVARVGERRYSPADVAELDRSWQQAVQRRIEGLHTPPWITTRIQGDEDEHLPPIRI